MAKVLKSNVLLRPVMFMVGIAECNSLLIYRVSQKSWAHFDVEYVKNYLGNNNASDIF